MSDRKYKQSDYQVDPDRGAERSGGGRADPPRPDRFGPRGRGLGQPTVERFRCRDCGMECETRVVTITATCSKCRAALHACVNCRSFDPSAPGECRADISVRQPSKTKANSCELWSAKVTAELGDGKPQDSKTAFDALFKGI